MGMSGALKTRGQVHGDKRDVRLNRRRDGNKGCCMVTRLAQWGLSAAAHAVPLPFAAAATILWSIAPKMDDPDESNTSKRKVSPNLRNDVRASPWSMVSTARRSARQAEPTSR